MAKERKSKKSKSGGEADSPQNANGKRHTTPQSLDAVAEERKKKLVEAHERFSRFFRAGRNEVVYPVLPRWTSWGFTSYYRKQRSEECPTNRQPNNRRAQF